MLKKQMTQYLAKRIEEKQATEGDTIQLEVFKEERAYIEKHHLLNDYAGKSISFIESEPSLRFADVYIERCDKETEELLAEESSTFMQQPIDYFKNHRNEFIYVESEWFDLIGVDAISFEADSVFGTYDVILGLKLQKKYGPSLKSFLTTQLSSDDTTFDLMFNGNDGLWDVNFALNSLSDFNGIKTIEEAFVSIYCFLFQLAEALEEENVK